MTLVGSWTYIQCSGVSNNEVLKMYATSETTTLKINNQSDFVPSVSDIPNSEVDYIGVENPSFSIRGFVDVNDQRAGYLSISGLYDVSKACGSYDMWFYDEAMLGAASGMWVVPRNIQFTRNNTYEANSYQVGHIITYNMTLDASK